MNISIIPILPKQNIIIIVSKFGCESSQSISACGLYNFICHDFLFPFIFRLNRQTIVLHHKKYY